MRWVVDASIAIKWVIIEDGREEARRFLLTNDDLIAPEFLVVEVANALRTKIARGQFEAENGARALEAVQSAIGTFIPDRQLVSDAFSLAARLRLRLSVPRLRRPARRHDDDCRHQVP